MIRYCTRCRQAYGEAVEGPLAGGAQYANAAPSYAPFCSKRCADVDLVHWLKGEYVIDGAGGLSVSDDEGVENSAQLPVSYGGDED